ncbi:unnamed protein product [Phyllotreta striolata]|uniref:UDP-glucuronosyltransferase n=1 Tax=Phyllotreta striolata TaxID=444603 RepID=A0A9N9TFI9_PHYSR|nr:unnamed protein product [Phyllotreta striolata]
MELKNLLFIIVSVSCVGKIHSAKILGLFPLAAGSHYSLGNTLMRGLAEAGHDVTMISPHNDTNPVKNGSYRNVVLTGFVESYAATMKKINLFSQQTMNSFTYLLKFQKATTALMEKTFQHPNIIELCNSNETFDVVIVEQMTSEAFKYFAYHFKGHLVLFSSVGAESKINYVVGNPTMVSFTPLIDTDFPRDMTLYQRIYNFLLYTFEAAVYKYHWLPFLDTLIQKYYPGAPSIFDINYNVSLVLVNHHESIQESVPLVPNIIPIGGFHVQKPKPLPKDLEEFLNRASEGVIYVSFGSVLKVENLPVDKKEILIRTFANMKQKILWKWEGDDVDNFPPNVKTAKWLPQRDVLAHPNVKLFVFPGGLLSLTEAISNGVPILTMPINADQATNGQIAVSNGYGLSITFRDPNFSEEKLTSMINELLNNSTFKEKAMERSRLFHDREVHPLQKAVYWIEHIIRHGGSHLKVWGVNLPWYQFYSLDVLGIVVMSVAILLAILCRIVKVSRKIICNVTRGNVGNKSKNQHRGSKKMKKH